MKEFKFVHKYCGAIARVVGEDVYQVRKEYYLDCEYWTLVI